jgi:hypothetical protein
METPFSACLVFKTQKGLVAMEDAVPANPEHLATLLKDPRSHPNIFLA